MRDDDTTSYVTIILRLIPILSVQLHSAPETPVNGGDLSIARHDIILSIARPGDLMYVAVRLRPDRVSGQS